MSRGKAVKKSTVGKGAPGKPFKKGQPKPAGSGRKKGFSPNRDTGKKYQLAARRSYIERTLLEFEDPENVELVNRGVKALCAAASKGNLRALQLVHFIRTDLDGKFAFMKALEAGGIFETLRSDMSLSAVIDWIADKTPLFMDSPESISLFQQGVEFRLKTFVEREKASAARHNSVSVDHLRKMIVVVVDTMEEVLAGNILYADFRTVLFRGWAEKIPEYRALLEKRSPEKKLNGTSR